VRPEYSRLPARGDLDGGRGLRRRSQAPYPHGAYDPSVFAEICMAAKDMNGLVSRISDFWYIPDRQHEQS
jgi:hypothetical protein